MKRVLALGFAALASFSASSAHADLPPEPGHTRVNYQFQIDAAIDGRALVAFPIYNFTDNESHSQVLAAGTDVRPVQGYTPGIYSVATADVASIPKGQDEAEKFLKAHGALCLKHVPRVFDVPTSTGVDGITDVIHVSQSGVGCQASLAKTIYGGPGGKRGEGGADASGNRTPPAPFASGLPSLGDSGFALASTSTPPSQPASSAAPSALPSPSTPSAPSAVDPPKGGAGCAGCAVSQSSAPWGAVGLSALLSLAAWRRRSARSNRAI